MNKNKIIAASEKINEQYGEAFRNLAKQSVKIKRLYPDAVIPAKAHAHDAGFDIVAVEDTIIEPGETALIKSGLAFGLPPGYAMDIRPRSGITLKTKLRVQYGTVDASYRGEVGVIVDNISQNEYELEDYGNDYGDELEIEVVRHNALHTIGNTGYTPQGNILTEDSVPVGTYIIRKGDRIAQAIIQRLPDVELIEVEALGDSERGARGFGSSGVKGE